jgi:probable F420-dependent oxidoreductase
VRIGVTAFLTDRTMSADDLARAVEERGYASLFLPEHTHLPVSAADPPALVRGVHADDYRRSLDPFVALAAAAAVTERIRLGTGVALVAQHDPIVMAKQIATLDHLSAGRFVLGMGYGWNRAEAADHGVDFARRRDVAREKVLCMQALWSQERAEFHGAHVSLPPAYAWPKPRRTRVPILVGAAAGPSTFAAIAEYGDGWMPIGGSGIAAAIGSLREAFAAAGRDSAQLEIVPFGTVPDRGKLDHYAALGCTEVVLRIPSAPADEMFAVLDDYSQYLDSRYLDSG